MDNNKIAKELVSLARELTARVPNNVRRLVQQKVKQERRRNPDRYTEWYDLVELISDTIIKSGKWPDSGYGVLDEDMLEEWTAELAEDFSKRAGLRSVQSKELTAVYPIPVKDFVNVIKRARFKEGLEVEVKSFGDDYMDLVLKARPWYYREVKVKFYTDGITVEPELLKGWPAEVGKAIGVSEDVYPWNFLKIPTLDSRYVYRKPLKGKRDINKWVKDTIKVLRAEEDVKMIRTKLKSAVLKGDRWIEAIKKRIKTVFGNLRPYKNNKILLQGFNLWEDKNYYVGIGISSIDFNQGSMSGNVFIKVNNWKNDDAEFFYKKKHDFRVLADLTRVFKSLKGEAKEAIAFAKKRSVSMAGFADFEREMERIGFGKDSSMDGKGFEIRNTAVAYEYGEPPYDEYERDAWYDDRSEEFWEWATPYEKKAEALAKKYGFKISVDGSAEYGSLTVTVED